MSGTWSMGSRRCPWRWVWRPSWCWSGSSSAQTTTPSWAACIYFWTRLWFYLYFWKITQFERLLLCVPEVDLSHGPRIESVQEVVVRSFWKNLVHLYIRGRWASSNFYKRGWHLVSPMYDKTGRSDLVSPLDDQALNGNLQLAVHLPTITLSHLLCSKSFFWIFDVLGI